MLKGIKIVEIEGLGPTPFAGMMFADLGADVTVIHRKNKSVFSNPKNILDRGKRSIELDLKNPEELEIAKKIICTSDVLIEGFRPGVMEKLGLGPNDLTENPSLVYGRMTGWGQDGPKSKQSGHDLNYIGLSGALWYASHPDSPPFTPPALVGDYRRKVGIGSERPFSWNSRGALYIGNRSISNLLDSEGWQAPWGTVPGC